MKLNMLILCFIAVCAIGLSSTANAARVWVGGHWGPHHRVWYPGHWVNR